ncbi:MAG: glycosyltransferase family 4 protein [Chitinispirillaceae bacterium]|nr:glycosyltransferase family 4 protein [Chitinispirillaceae bacterium]
MKKKWCIIVDRFYPESAGVGNSSFTLACALIRKGYAVSVLTPRSNGILNRFEVVDKIAIYRIGGRFLEKYGILVYGFYCYFFLRGLFLLQFTICPDYVLGQTPWEGGILSGVSGILSRKRISLVHTHGSIFHANRILALARLAYCINKVVLATNNEYAFQVKKMVPRVNPFIARNIFIPDSIPGSKDELRHRYGMDDGRFHCIGIGRMVYERCTETKGFSFAIRAISTIPDATLHLFGDGPNREMYQRLSTRLSADVRFHGVVGKKELYSYMKAADCFLQSSLTEGLSMSMIEAFAYRLPVITTRTSGALDIIDDGKNGLLVNQGDADSIIGALLKLIADSALRRTLSDNGYLTFQKQFTEDIVINQYISAVDCTR